MARHIAQVGSQVEEKFYNPYAKEKTGGFLGGSWFVSAVGYSIVALFAVICAYYVYNHRHEFSFLNTVSYSRLGLAGLMILFTLLLAPYQLGLFLKHFGLPLRHLELASLATGMMLGNLVLPMRGGTGGLVVYLKRVHDLDLSALGAIYAGTGLLFALINAALGLGALAWLFAFHGYFNLGLTVVVLGLFTGCAYLSIFPPPVRWKSRGILGFFFDTANSWRSFVHDRSLFYRLTGYFLLSALALTGAFYFIYEALAAPLSLSAVLITSSLGNIANLAPITPGSLGIFDAVTIQLPLLFGLDPARAIAATLAFRAVYFLCALPLGVPSIIYLVGLAHGGTRAGEVRENNRKTRGFFG